MAGITNRVTKVANAIPKNTTVPTAIRLSEPAPVEKISGTAPTIAVKEVIRIGRKRRAEASITAC
ncbi:MAG: hypothetical protein Sw2LagBPW_06030 [Shewanella algae]